MITPRMILRGKEYISSHRLRSAVHEELIKREVLNPSTNKPFTKSYVDMVLRGQRENIDIENVFVDMILKRKAKRDKLAKAYKKEFEEH